jgi:hypothetical protein
MEGHIGLYDVLKEHLFILDEQNCPIPTDDTAAWGKWFATADRVVERTFFKTMLGEVLVSTVFLAINHNFLGGPPLLYETMVFTPRPLLTKLAELSEHYATDDADWVDIQERYYTREEAERRHQDIAQFVEIALYRLLQKCAPNITTIRSGSHTIVFLPALQTP